MCHDCLYMPDELPWLYRQHDRLMVCKFCGGELNGRGEWAAEHPVVYPTWGDWLAEYGVVIKDKVGENTYKYNTLRKVTTPIPADIAEKLGIEPIK